MSIFSDADLLHIQKPCLGKIKVFFFVYSPSIWDSHSSVYQAMLANHFFEPYVFLAPTLNSNQELIYEENAIQFFEEQGIDFILSCSLEHGTYISIEALSPDVVFYQSPYYYGIADYAYNILSEYTRLAYIPYGLYLAQMQDLQFNLPLHNIAWKVFAESPMHKLLYAHYKNNGDSNVVISGYPKFDIYSNLKAIDCSQAPWKITKESNPNIKRILWTPHWMVHAETKYTLFSEYIEFFIDYLSKNTSKIEMILKPHPLLFTTLVKEGVYTPTELQSLLDRFNDLPNASVYAQGNYFPLFLTSDAMINSSISFMAEYLPSKKPMLFMPNINDQGVNEFGEAIREQHYLGYSQSDVLSFIDNVVIKGKDTMYTHRKKSLHKLLHLPPEGAAYHITKTIKEGILADPIWQATQSALQKIVQKNERKKAYYQKRRA